MRRIVVRTTLVLALVALAGSTADLQVRQAPGQQEVFVSVGAVNRAEADGTTPLHHAARLGDAARVQSLIRAGANVNAANRYGVTPLALAAANGDAAMIDTLLKAGADAKHTSGEGQTVLMTAARTGNADAVRMLIERGAYVNAREGWLGESALMLAAAANHGAAVSVLTKAGADVNAKSNLIDFPEQRFTTSGMVTTYLNRGGFTALMFAAREDAKEAVKALIASGANLNMTDDDGTTAMSLAAINGHMDVVNMLLEAGANPNIVDKVGMGPLYAVVEMNTLDTLFGRPMPKVDDDVTPVELARRLIARGADPNATLKAPTIQRHHNAGNGQMGEGTSPVFRAAKNGDVDMIRALIDGGARLDMAQRDGTTVLMTAITSGASSIFSTASGSEGGQMASIRLLIDRGIDVNAANAQGRAALHIAANAGNDAIVRVLAEAGAKLDLQDRQGLTALDLASGRGAAAAGGRGGGGGGGRAGGAPQIRVSTAKLLRELMGLPPDPALDAAPQPAAEPQN